MTIAKEYPLVVIQENMPQAGGVANTTDVGGPEATDEYRLGTNAVAYITGEPAAAELTAEFLEMPDWHQVVWGGRLGSERTRDRFGLDDRTLLACTGTVYDITAALTNEVIGGGVTLTASLDGRPLPDYSFSIRGKNPLDNTAEAYITGNVDAEFADFAWKFAKHESLYDQRLYNQFNPKEDEFKEKPFKGNDDDNWGWGICQIDGSNMVSSVVWNWHENVLRMNELLREKRTMYRTYVNRYRTSYASMPGVTWTEPPSTNINGVAVSAEMWSIFVLFNGTKGVPWQQVPSFGKKFRSPVQFNPATGDWTFHNNTINPEYVYDLIVDSETEGVE